MNPKPLLYIGAVTLNSVRFVSFEPELYAVKDYLRKPGCLPRPLVVVVGSAGVDWRTS